MSAVKNMSALKKARQFSRDRWGRSTPYRLGFSAGYLALPLENPYDKPIARLKFEEGQRDGAHRAVRGASYDRRLRGQA